MMNVAELEIIADSQRNLFYLTEAKLGFAQLSVRSKKPGIAAYMALLPDYISRLSVNNLDEFIAFACNVDPALAVIVIGKTLTNNNDANQKLLRAGVIQAINVLESIK